MKKTKLNLSNLKVKSFVTEVKDSKENTVKGGAAGTHYSHCSFDGCNCEETNPLLPRLK